VNQKHERPKVKPIIEERPAAKDFLLWKARAEEEFWPRIGPKANSRAKQQMALIGDGSSQRSNHRRSPPKS
jgi:hypothetical protein